MVHGSGSWLVHMVIETCNNFYARWNAINYRKGWGVRRRLTAACRRKICVCLLSWNNFQFSSAIWQKLDRIDPSETQSISNVEAPSRGPSMFIFNVLDCFLAYQFTPCTFFQSLRWAVEWGVVTDLSWRFFVCVSLRIFRVRFFATCLPGCVKNVNIPVSMPGVPLPPSLHNLVHLVEDSGHLFFVLCRMLRLILLTFYCAGWYSAALWRHTLCAPLSIAFVS